MILGEPLGLLALLGIPAILAIHLFRRRFRPRPVSALWLYGPVPETPAAGRRRSRLSNRRSLWLELMACLALAWWLSDPHLDDRSSAEHLVVVLDDRWRMQAEANGESTRERAVAALETIIDGLARDDRITLLRSGEPPGLLAGPEADAFAARRALAGWDPAAPFHPLDPALRLGRELLAAGGEERRRGRLLLVSDHEPAGLPPGTGLLLRGHPAANDALIEARWLRADPYGPERLVLRVQAAGGGPRTRSLALHGATGELARRPLDLRPDAVTSLTWPLGALATDGLQELELELVGSDALALDDRLRLRRPAARTLRVHLDPELPRPDWWRRALAAQLHAELVEDRERAHLLVLGPDAPLPGDGRWSVRVAPDDGPAVLGPYLARTGHPLLRDLDATGAVWAGGAAIEDPGAVLLAAADRALVSEAGEGRARAVTLHLDPARSTLDRHPAWPALVANLVAWARDAVPGLAQPNQPLGVALEVVLPPGAERLQVIVPEGERGELVADATGRVVLPPLQVAGTHRLRLDDEEADWQVLEAVPGDPRLADTAALQRADRAPEAGGEAEVARRRGPLAHLLPLLVAAALVIGAWWSFAREEGLATRPREVAA